MTDQALPVAFLPRFVLPLLPDRALDPLGAINPHELWLLVVLISFLSLIGYVAVRLLGTGRGTALTGLFGGMTSSTAVTLTFSRRSVESGGERQTDALATGSSTDALGGGAATLTVAVGGALRAKKPAEAPAA
jgi:uncharacterized membrane protein (DUF4010 family)